MEGSMSALLAKPFLRLFLHLWRYLCLVPAKSLLVKRMMQADFCDKNLCFVYNKLQAAKVMLNLQEKGGYERIVCYFAKCRFSEAEGTAFIVVWFS